MRTAENRTSVSLDASRAGFRDVSHPLPHREERAGDHRCPSPFPAIVDGALRIFIEQLEEGLAVVDRRGRALFLNAAARRMVDGEHLVLTDGVLRANARSASLVLHKMLADCVSGGREIASRLVFETETLLIAASALPPERANSEAAVLLRLINPATAPLPSAHTLRAQFGFTSTEAAFALEMLAGNDLAACAARRGITLNTARAHLRSLFDKTDTRRQAALVRLLLLCPRPIMD
jgi:DNA-binding CsgD family transcriptional regulator